MDFIINYGFILAGIIITLLAQGYINYTYNKYKKIKNNSSITGVQMARYILDKNDLKHVSVVATGGVLTDHYDPRKKIVRLSNDIYENDSIAAISVAAHECGHAIQDKEKYFMMKLRALLVPVVNISSYLGYFALLIGFTAGILDLVWLGIYAELAILLFQLVTLPVEINASKKALKELKEYNLIVEEEYKGSRNMLIAAASTYVASLATTFLQILRLINMANRKRR